MYDCLLIFETYDALCKDKYDLCYYYNHFRDVFVLSDYYNAFRDY